MKKFIRLAASVLAIVTLALCFSACQKEETVTIDIEKLAEELSKVKYVDDMVKLDDSVVSATYALTNGSKKAVVYGASGATPEEIIIAEYETADAARDAMSKYSDRVTAQKKTFDTYNAEYRPLLNQMILQQSGKYIIYCVSSDYDAAARIVNSYVAK